MILVYLTLLQLKNKMSISDFALIIPVLVCIILLLFFRSKVVWWEYLVILLPSILLVIGLRLIMVSYNSTATEYFGDYVSYVQHYDHWDEWIEKTCSSTCCCDSKGNNCITTTYDCSYREDHPEYWVKVTETGREIDIDEQEYTRLVQQFHSSQEFVPMHRDFYQINGDAQRYSYQNDIGSTEPIITSHLYTNKVKASSSIFKFDKVTKEDVKQWHLFNYPEINDYHQFTVLGIQQPSQSTQRKFNYINGVFGPKRQIHLFILFYKNQPYDVDRKSVV